MRKLVIGLVAGLLLGVTTVAVASIPAADGTITGCRNTKNGTLRVIDAEAGQTCGKDEVRLTWNQTGPAGLQGPAGPAGVAGYQLVTNSTPVPNAGAAAYWSATALCSPGKKVLGGGGSTQLTGQNNLFLVRSVPVVVDGQEGWSVTYQRRPDIVGDTSVDVNAICADVGS
jgi:hypothetical protein